MDKEGEFGLLGRRSERSDTSKPPGPLQCSVVNSSYVLSEDGKSCSACRGSATLAALTEWMNSLRVRPNSLG
eukprot:3706182-Pyramimonas_sp.AAC.1